MTGIGAGLSAVAAALSGCPFSNEPQRQTVLGGPSEGIVADALLNHTVALNDAVPPGEELYGTTLALGEGCTARLVTALNCAYERGVDVYVISNKGQRNTGGPGEFGAQ